MLKVNEPRTAEELTAWVDETLSSVQFSELAADIQAQIGSADPTDLYGAAEVIICEGERLASGVIALICAWVGKFGTGRKALSIVPAEQRVDLIKRYFVSAYTCGSMNWGHPELPPLTESDKSRLRFDLMGIGRVLLLTAPWLVKWARGG